MDKITANFVKTTVETIRRVEDELKEIDKISNQYLVVIKGETNSVLLNGKAERDVIINIIRENRLNQLKKLEEQLNDI